MKKRIIILSILPVLLFWLLTGCSSDKSGSDQSQQDESTEVQDEISQEEVTTTEQDKSKRPSPPQTASLKIGDLEITLNYSSPGVKGRNIWGELVPYGEVWRTGANEANVFSVSKDVLINGEALPAGKYALFTIPGKSEWTVIFNKEWNQWGSFNYHESEDALRISVTPQQEDELKERMEFRVNENGEVSFRWENLSFTFSVASS